MAAMDRRTALYAALSLFQGLLVGAIPLVTPSRSEAVNWVLGAAAVAMLLAAPALLWGGRRGRAVAAAACLLHGLVGTVLSALVLGSASYIYGIYGHHGHTVGTMAFVFVAFLLVLFWLIPGHELRFLRAACLAERGRGRVGAADDAGAGQGGAAPQGEAR